MKIALWSLLLVCGVHSVSHGQTTPNELPKAPVWTEADRKYLLDNLIRSKEEILSETKNLTKEQWNFKESPDRWSINQIVEHLCLWEVITMNDVSGALRMGPLSDFTHYVPDSLFIDHDPGRLKKSNTTEYSKPFTYGVPLGNNEGKNNIIWYTTLTNESIDYLKKTSDNLRIYYICFGPNIHQRFMMFFQHSFRHLAQIKEVKAHPKYPK